MKKQLIGAVVATAMFAAPLAATAATWMAYTFGPSENLANVQGMKRVMEDIEKNTGGEVKFRLRLAGSLPIQATDITQAVGNGTVRFADDGFYLGNVRIAGILRLPMLLRSQEDFDKAYAIMKPYVERDFGKQGVVVLGHFSFPHQVIFSARKLESLADIKGQKLRVSSPEQAAFVQRAGGIPVTLGGAEVPSALSAGTIDGALTASAGGGKIWGDMLKYNLRLPVNYFDGFYLVNKKAFEALSPEMQAKMRESVARQAPGTTAQIAKEEGEVTDALRQKGMVIVPSTSAMEQAATDLVSGYWEDWAREQGPEAVQALAEVRKALGR
ncbi:TRAP transporter substrate-binding protein [Bordetella bronchiseptica]|uniref:TRAP transporter substrate-binding protein n=1 Tax=Bordetella bronchiseptica TaxID=518 RepID=UPI0004A177F7|nr:TRAP transporter substrate-binding protein [Bordetella bronchiseptica]AWP78408.1 ABC transporter substrate-binding protein [Bordetella bronchiseptica]KDC88201.1 ABC transporter, substrate-binding protein, family 7 [Bordetella bronchiseptica MBORD665]KDC89918.1 ABC transporter, substrate-binding protein, family 7 [Bordetella bronchiseptica MBORD668]SUV72724.1 ABC transporter substrate-binding protein [Bordetella bronchiseptica]VEI29012.1 ABC transporter substrate-binding protein [Bordetella 